ncbi:ankyrin repeat-containing domain protein [Baffinella frigidus]|nr:ankyrin repeat-containing domain protein [Cryptophyta sp. CCMP2293]
MDTSSLERRYLGDMPSGDAVMSSLPEEALRDDYEGDSEDALAGAEVGGEDQAEQFLKERGGLGAAVHAAKDQASALGAAWEGVVPPESEEMEAEGPEAEAIRDFEMTEGLNAPAPSQDSMFGGELLADENETDFLANRTVSAIDRLLLDAAEQGDAAKIRMLIAKGASPNACEGDVVALCAIHHAALGGHLDAFQTLVSLDAVLMARAGTGDGVLHYAAEAGSIPLVRYLLLEKSVPVDDPGFSDTTPAFSAVEFGQDAVLAELLARGASPNATDMFETSLLHFAALQGRVGPIDALITAGANLEAEDWAWKTPFLVAVEQDNMDAAKALLAHGANLEARAENGKNALEWAEWRG